MVSNVDRIYVTRRSRSRTPSRVATPQVKKTEKNKPAKKRYAIRSGPRARSKTPTRSIKTSTPKHSTSKKASTSKASSSKSSTSKSSANSIEKSSKKRKSIVLNDLSDIGDSDDEVEYSPSSAKKQKSPKTGLSTPKPAGRSKKSLSNDDDDEADGNVRRSRRIRDLVSVTEEPSTRPRKSVTFNGGVNAPRASTSSSRASTSSSQNETIVANETTEQEQGRKWGWFSCAIM